MKAIVAVDLLWSIGKDGDLLFHIPKDMKFFRETTSGKVVVMGRKTLDSFPGGRPLKNRVNIVLTRDPAFQREGVTAVGSVDEALELLQAYDPDDVYIIGGESVYEAFLPYCDTALVTHVDAAAQEADKRFPCLARLPEWELAEESAPVQDEGYTLRFCTYRRIK